MKNRLTGGRATITNSCEQCEFVSFLVFGVPFLTVTMVVPYAALFPTMHHLQPPLLLFANDLIGDNFHAHREP